MLHNIDYRKLACVESSKLALPLHTGGGVEFDSYLSTINSHTFYFFVFYFFAWQMFGKNSAVVMKLKKVNLREVNHG